MNEKIFNIIEYGAVADGVTLNSAAVQRAVEACSAKGGGQVYFPAGKYALSTVFLKSNTRIYLEEGAEILGALSFYDFAPEEEIDYPAYQDSSHTYYHCSLFVGENCDNVCITGKGKIDMRSVWDEDNVRKIKHRGPKCIALKNCKNVEISGLGIYNVTDLAVYFAGCENVDVFGLKMRVYIDGISPDNSKNVRIHDCEVEAGDDAIVFKSSYTLNRLDVCKNIRVWNCRLKSRCYALKFGTETNGGFEDFEIENISIKDTRIGGIGIESVDGAVLDKITIRNVKMENVNAPIFVHIGRRMRGPKGRSIGRISNVTLENITADGPYKEYEIVPWNYFSFKDNDVMQKPWVFGIAESFDDTYAGLTENDAWQMTCNVCGLEERPLKNITLRNIHMRLVGGVSEYEREVPEKAQEYPEVYGYGRILPAKGIYFRHVDGLTLDNVRVETIRPDVREDFVFDDVKGLTQN